MPESVLNARRIGQEPGSNQLLIGTTWRNGAGRVNDRVSCSRAGTCENAAVGRVRLPWMLAVPLVVAGSIAAHLVGYTATRVTAQGGHEEGGELSGLHERASSGYAGHAVLWLGLIGALATVFGIRALVARRNGSTSRGVGAGCFFLLPLLAYSFQELIERLLHAESFPFHAVLEPRFLFGLALQLPFAALAFLLAWALSRVARRLAHLFGRRPIPPLRALPEPLWALSGAVPPRVRALSRGHPLRGPPLLA